MAEYQNHIITKNGQRILPKTIASIVEDTPRNQSVEQTLTDLLARNDVYIAVIDATQDPMSCSIQEYANISNAINHNTTVVAKVVYGTNLFIFIPLSFFRDDIDGHSAVFSILLSGTNAIFTIYQNDSEVDFEIVNSTPIWGNIEGNIEDQHDLNSALNDLSDSIDYVQMGVDAIEELIPTQATSTNQLADKEFVNSSVSTATATYKGNFNVVTDLNLHYDSSHGDIGNALDNTISVADNNDYCFVEIPTSDLTPTETLQVDRYKYNGTSWSFEYTLNNSGYTSAQWKAINSGITSGKVTQYDGYATSKQDTIVAGTNITIGTDGKTISSDIPQATQSVAGKVLLGASGGAATYESIENRLPICYPTIASDVQTTSMLVKSSVSDNGKILTENGFVYNTSGNPTISDTKVICDLGVGWFEKKLENLTQNTEYHIKSYGQNSSGLVYGSELVQRTIGNPIPGEYQLVEYLQSSGTQYIKTTYIPNINHTITSVMAVISGTSNAYSGCSNTNNRCFWGVFAAAGLIIANSSGSWAYLSRPFDAVKRTFVLSPTSVSIDIVADTNHNIYPNLPIYLFARNNNNTVSDYAQFRIESFIVTDENSNYVVRMYPVYRIADNKPGMYDIVNGVFYTNQGTGEFIVGPDKEWDE